MAYHLETARRIREILAGSPGLVEKKMFGGVGFLLGGNMACGVHRDSLIVRVGLEQYQDALSRPGARPFDLTGRAMSGWVAVDLPGFSGDAELRAWVQAGVDYARKLPLK